VNAAATVVRDASEQDGQACAEIYAPFVRDTAVSFELDPPTAAEMSARIGAAQQDHAWLVAVRDGLVIGYAYAGRFAARPAYRFACETSVYLSPDARGTGLGRLLYGELHARLVQRGLRTALAGMTLPNEASAGLHRALGYEVAGTYRRVGFKLGAWHDVAWFQKQLTPP
jgi:L-amino acid N-acyltransferase YncA